MKHIVRKAYYDFEKEEKYLNEMSAKGLALTDYTWCRYVFQDAPKGQYIYRIELLENSIHHPESQNYINFMEETGAEFVASYLRWVYFRRKASDGEFNIYSDMGSRLKHYKRIRMLFLGVFILNLFAGILNYTLGIVVPYNGVPPFNSYISILSFSVAALFLIFLIVPLSKKINSLGKERKIRE